MNIEFEDMPPIHRDEAIAELESEDTQRVSRALVRLALHDADRRWLEDVVVEHLQSNDPWVRGVAATCAGHIARLHGALDTTRIVPIMQGLASDVRTLGRMEDALEDIQMFVPGALDDGPSAEERGSDE